MTILFGTDGVRGPANREPMTADTVLKLGMALGEVVRSSSSARTKILVGKDTRLSGYMFENALCAGICAMGVDVLLVGPMPTPGIAFLTTNMRCDAGVMISASHNPAEDNGIKLFYRDGYKLSDELESRIEYEVFNSNGNRKFPIGGHVGKAFRIADALGRYIVFVKNVFPKNISLSGFNIHVDCANGAGYKAAPLIFEELGASVKSLGSKPNGRNINLNCGSLFPEGLRKSVRLGGADLGIALDGDADRVIFVDENGEEVDGDRILGLIALHMMSRSELKENTLVATIMSNIGLDNLMHSHGGSIIRTPVGDRYVIERMRQGGFNFGGEPSGHLIFLDNSTCGDGILGALHVLRIMLETGMPLSELIKDIPCYPQIKNDVPISIRPPLDEIPELVSAIKDSERKLSNNGRILVRYSGTQSVCRIQAEGDDPDHLKEIVELLSGIVEKYTNEQERKL